MTKVAVITGASSGIGLSTAHILQRKGYQVIGGARHVDNLQNTDTSGVKFLKLDVTNHESVTQFVKQIINDYGNIDLVINSAGYGLFGALEEVDLEDARNQLEVNLFGMADLNKQILPGMRLRHSGRIVNISSLAGKSYSPLGGWYHISKHAVETYSDVLRTEVEDFGIKVVVVEPGITDTNWQSVANNKLLNSTSKASPYRNLAEKVAKVLTNTTATPDEVG